MIHFSAVPRALIILMAALGAVILALFGVHFVESQKFTESSVVKAGRLQELRGDILHYDEVLTMSAYMASATSDPRWSARYRQYEPRLTDAITEFKSLLPNQDAAQAAAELEAANNRLVALEHQALDLVAKGRSKVAFAILDGSSYKADKESYSQKLSMLFATIRSFVKERMDEQAHRMRMTVTLGGVSLILLLVLLFCSNRRSQAWHRAVTSLVAQLQGAEATIAKERNELEIRIAERTEELAQAQDRAEAANGIKSRYLAVMTHELKTPLNAIAGFASLLAKNPTVLESEKLLKYVRNLQIGSDHMKEIVGDLLDLAKIESGHVELSYRETDLGSLVQEAVQMMQPLADKAEIKLDVIVSAGLPRVEIDPVRIRQVMINLLGNSVKFTPAERTVTVTVQEAGKEHLRVSVIDQGPGLGESDLEAVFEQYVQTGTPEQRRKGNGLGLPLSRELARLHKGRLWVESAGIGTGCTFICELPIKQGQSLDGDSLAA